jgi:pimeloyl-ACP methyl ester carboxylesterase
MLTQAHPRRDMVLGLSAHGFHKLAVHTWCSADPWQPSAICVHGLTRTGRDFDLLAERLSATRAVFCPDVVGRGASDWLPTAEAYGYAQYQADMTGIIARMAAPEVDWIGTSMGGLIGMMLAAQPGTPIRRLVLNDVGPFIPAAALRAIAEYVGQDPHFTDLDAARDYIRTVHAQFGDLTPAQWDHLTRHAIRPTPEGGFRLAYDPKIAAPFAETEQVTDVELWGVWDAITCPVLVLRGEDSQLLPAETADEMRRRGPGAEVVTVPDAGHAPALMAAEQIEAIQSWLDARARSDQDGQPHP